MEPEAPPSPYDPELLDELARCYARAALDRILRKPQAPEPIVDRPKLLGDAAAVAARRAQLAEPHIAPLAAYVAALRDETGFGAAVPDFDPWDGGIEAQILFLLEAPGPRAVRSGFVSRNNPDETAKNFFEVNAEAGIPRTTEPPADPQTAMSFKDWVWLGSILLWGLFGFWTGDAYRRHDWVGFGLGFALWVVFPIAIAVKRQIGQALWRREWERRHGKPWSESEAAMLERNSIRRD